MAMPLYIGKNHKGEAHPVQSIFRLAGNDEDALTFALGFLLAHDSSLCTKLLRLLRITPRRSLEAGYSVFLQEVTDSGFGRRDVVIQDSRMRIVLEAKIGGAEPTPQQLLKYGTEKSLWHRYKTCGVVALTQVQLAASTAEEVEAILSERGIRFTSVQWHEIVDLALNHIPTNDTEVSRYLFDEFINYIRGDYRMGYYDAEVLVQDVNPLNRKIFEEGWMYVTSLKDKRAPMYFAPYFTGLGANSGISMLSRVESTKSVILADCDDILEAPTAEHLECWRRGLVMLRKRAEEEDFLNNEARLFYLDRPIQFRETPLSKKAFNRTGTHKRIPSQIPKGFSLRFDELLRPQ